MKTSEILYKAADVIRERGRCPNDLADSRGRVCMLGAINVVERGNPFEWGDLFGDGSVERHLEMVIDEDIATFSNDHCRSADDCAAAFEIAADIAAAEGK